MFRMTGQGLRRGCGVRGVTRRASEPSGRVGGAALGTAQRRSRCLSAYTFGVALCGSAGVAGSGVCSGGA
ncbi:hypothetical protein LMG27174_04125 [Paraburkholderia rhynchosiae]|uniref:Uncharacterized protein n=1 Tax=Paraburkholderia rhynchosiae TaxID=487049 RepID=A0A6J5BKF0_9BURK|nr:hypothetical protein LMG27174_04125 [Paraburkholderia rhynchosiae]